MHKFPKNRNSEYAIREIIEGKPHVGKLYGCTIVINSLEIPDINEKLLKEYEEILIKKIPDFLILKNHIIAYRPPYRGKYIGQNATFSIKGILYGRAFEVMRFLDHSRSKNFGKKHAMKKVYLCGRRKKVKYEIRSSRNT